MTQTKQQVLLTKKRSGVAVILLDCPGRSNVLNASVLDELLAAVTHVKADPEIKAAVVISGKKDTFLSGADLAEVRRFATFDDAYKLCKDGQALLSLTKHCGKPLVMAVNGPCLGGGIELILCGHKRIATREPITVFAMPEVKLGLIPGLAGTQRLPRLLGVKGALELILSSEPIDADKALEMGLIDEIVETNDLLTRAEELALQIAESGDTALAPLVSNTEENPHDYDPAKLKQLFAITERSLRIKTKGHYPAPMAAVSVMKEGLEKGIEAGMDIEARAFSDLCMSDVTHNLMSVTIAGEFYKQSALVASKRTGAPAIATVGVIGTGMMGVAIAELAAIGGYNVILKGRDQKRIDEAVEKIRTTLARVEQRSQSHDKKLVGQIAGVTDMSHLSKCDLVIESSLENAEIKREIFRELLGVVQPKCVLATNTSSLAVTAIVPDGYPSNRVIGLHFFFPVDRMPLVEVVSHGQSDRDAIAAASTFVASLGKIPLTVKDGTGFLVNRILSCYLEETARLADEKVPANWIDDAAVSFGMPLGPFEVLDEVGWELVVTIAEALHAGLGERMTPPEIMFRSYATGFRGKRAGIGVFIWDEYGKKKGYNPDVLAAFGADTEPEKPGKEKVDEIVERLILPAVDEAARCLEEKIVLRPREVDMAMVFGIGFPPFRGGLLRWADKVGLPYIRQRLEAIYEKQTPRRTVSDLIKKLEAEGRGFYGKGSGDES